VFDDRGIRFTVFVEERAPAAGGRAGASLAAQDLLHRLARSPATVAELAGRGGLGASQVRYLLKGFLESGAVRREPLDGRTFRYRVAT
jgi:DNA-binding IclR family transcriptional regulator